MDNKDNKEIDINKTIEENQIKKNTTIIINPKEKFYEGNNNKNKISENNNKEEKIKENKINNKEENKDKDNKEENGGENKDRENKGENKDNDNKEENKDNDKKKEDKRNINNKEISMIMKDGNQNIYEFKCKKTDELCSLKQKLFDKDKSLTNQKINFFINEKKIDISNTIEQSNITNDTIITFKAEINNNPDNEDISVIIKSVNQDFKSSFICKKTDKFVALKQKLYEKNPKLNKKPIYFLNNGQAIDEEKTIEENKIKDSDILIYNFNEFFEEEV